MEIDGQMAEEEPRQRQKGFCSLVLCTCCHRCLEVAGCTALGCIAVLFYFTRVGMTLKHNPLYYVAVWQSVAFFATIYSTVVSVWHMRDHIMYSTAKQKLQSNTLRILLLVPLYGFAALGASMVEASHRHWAVIITSLREAYEALVLISFVQWILVFWGGAQQMAAKMSNEEVKHFFFARPFFRKRAPGSDFVSFVLVGILQYAFVMLLVLLLQIVIWWWIAWAPEVLRKDVWGVISGTTLGSLKLILDHVSANKIVDLIGNFDLMNIPKVIKLVSNGFAMYCLLLWYERLLENHNTKDKMRSIKGIHKFLCIKSIILLTLWQETLVKFALKNGVISSHFIGVSTAWTPEYAADGLLNILICVEMLLFAEWHCYAYSSAESLPEDVDRRRPSWCLGPFFRLLCTSHIGRMLKDVKALRQAAKRQRQAVRIIRATIRSARRSNSSDLSEEQQASLEDAMMKFDHQDRIVSIAQLEFLLLQCGLSSQDRVHAFLGEADTDGDGNLTVAECIACAQKLYHEQPDVQSYRTESQNSAGLSEHLLRAGAGSAHATTSS